MHASVLLHAVQVLPQRTPSLEAYTKAQAKVLPLVMRPLELE
jgi:hypothetical protein